MNKHDLVAALKNLAIDLGRTPTLSEFENAGRGFRYGMTKQFGTFGIMLQAAGLETYNERRSGPQRITNEVFNKDIEQHLEDYKPKDLPEQKPWPKIAILPDIHFPWESKKVLEAFYKFISEHQPEHVVQIGDLYDMYSHSKFARSHNQFVPREETEISRKKAVEMWAMIKGLCPSAKLTQMVGNHDLRPLKRILEVYPAAEDWIQREVERLLTFEGVETIFDARQELIIGDIAIFHGYRSRPGSHRDYTQMNCITGHVHRGNVVYRQISGRVLWELHCGLAGDVEGKGLTYSSQKMSDWTPGFGFVWPWGPQFVPVG